MIQCLKFVIYMLRKSLLPILFISNITNALPLGDEENSIEKPSDHLSSLGERAFLEPDSGNWNEASSENPEEFAGCAEGDIVVSKRNGLIRAGAHWENGVVPYEIAETFSPNDLDIITRAINIFKTYTCITFRPRLPTDKDYISIVNDEPGCFSYVGREGGKQEVNLQSPNCTTVIGHALHELTHALGFLHEQNRYERDDFVTIAWPNIKKDHEFDFQKAGKRIADGFGVPYDFQSIMRYRYKAFSKNGEPTIIPKDKSKIKEMGQRQGLSRGDITKINAMYNCPEKTLAIAEHGTNITSNGNSSGGNENNEKKPSSNPLVNAATGLLSLFVH